MLFKTMYFKFIIPGLHSTPAAAPLTVGSNSNDTAVDASREVYCGFLVLSACNVSSIGNNATIYLSYKTGFNKILKLNIISIQTDTTMLLVKIPSIYLTTKL